MIPTIDLPWYQISRNEWRAETVFGQAKVVDKTFPPWYRYRPNGPQLGFTVYFKGRRVGWVVEGADANGLAAATATAEAMTATKGRLSQCST